MEFRLLPETIQATVSLIDRFLQCKKVQALSDFQLIGITAMFIACKFHELYPPVISDFIQVTYNSFTKKQLLELEVEMMIALDFDFNCTIP